jgi:uncharacterized protein YfaS (alpha-2-macroglobulin family)
VQLPEAAQGRALLTIENGSSVLEHRWIEARGVNEAGKEKSGANRISIPITAGMAPNVYVAVTMVQPHAGKANDRPIRLYGVIPLKVTDPATKLTPVVASAAEWAPKSRATVTVSESSGRAMDYTLAIVDEGLLGLTNFRTPNLRDEFYRREALGVSTWDLFDEVAARTAVNWIACWRSAAATLQSPPTRTKASRAFPPVVRFLGPVLAQGRREACAQCGSARVRGRGARDGGGGRRQCVRLGGKIRSGAPGADDPAHDSARHRAG